MKMKALMYYAPQQTRLEYIDIKDPAPGEVQVKIKAALTCGTDVKTYKRSHPVLIKKTPSPFGHEFSGVINKIGENVFGFKEGDRIACANSAPCFECSCCRRGFYNLCENIEFLNGAFAEYINVPAAIVKRNLIKIPDDLSYERAAFAEPLANVVHGADKTDIKPGQAICILGLGPIGIMFAKLAKIKGAKVIAGGRNPLKLKTAREFDCADEIIDLSKYQNPQKILLELSENKQGFDAAVDCTGQPEIWETAFNLAHKGGTVQLFGGCAAGSSVNFDTRRLHYDSLKIISTFHYTPEYFREALKLIYEDKLPVEKLITDTMTLDYAEAALIKHMNGQAVKVLILPS